MGLAGTNLGSKKSINKARKQLLTCTACPGRSEEAEQFFVGQNGGGHWRRQ